MRQFKRSDRVAEEIRRIASEVWDSEMASRLPGMVTFTRCDLSGDLRYAKLYYSYLGTPTDRERLDNFLIHNTKKMRRLIGSNLRIRHIPELAFKFDPSIEEGVRIEELLNEINRDKQE
jgi:ribosome-binding factor A